MTTIIGSRLKNKKLHGLFKIYVSRKHNCEHVVRATKDQFNSKYISYLQKKNVKLFVLSVISLISTLLLFFRFGLLNSQDPNTMNYNGIGWFLQNSDAGGWLQCAERLAVDNTLGLPNDGFTQWCLRRPGYALYLGTLIKMFDGYSHLVILAQLFIAVFFILLLVSKIQKYSKVFALVIVVYTYKIFQMFGGSTLTEMLGIPSMALAIYLLIVACETKKIEIFGLSIFTFAFTNHARPFNSALPFLALTLIIVLLRRYSLLTKKSLVAIFSFFSVGMFFFETWRLIGFSDANHGSNSWVSIYSFVKGDPTGWSVAYKDFPNVNGLNEIEYFGLIQHETLKRLMSHPFDWMPIFIENSKSYLATGGTYAFQPKLQMVIFASIVISILFKLGKRGLRAESFVALAIVGTNVIFAGILWPNEGQRISIPSNILVMSLIPVLTMIKKVKTEKRRNKFLRSGYITKIQNRGWGIYLLCALLIISSLGWKVLPKIDPSQSVQQSTNFCGLNGLQLISEQSVTITGIEGGSISIPLTLSENMTMSRNSISKSLSEGDSRFFLSSYLNSDYQLRRMLYVNKVGGGLLIAFGIDTQPSVKGCWEPIANLNLEKIDQVKLLNIGLTHFSKKQ